MRRQLETALREALAAFWAHPLFVESLGHFWRRCRKRAVDIQSGPVIW